MMAPSRRNRIIGGIVVCAALASCGPKEEQKAAPLSPKIERVIAPLPADPQQAAIELQQRLDANIGVKDGFLIVRDPMLTDMHESILPTTTQWSIGCGIGFSVVFGPEISGGNGDTENAVKLDLALGVIPKEICDIAGLAVARHLRAALAGSPTP